MKITFLGTNGWYTNQNGNTACVLIESKTHYIIFDAGNGFYNLDKYIKKDKPILLFISHFHIDHISGLHTLVKFDFPQGIDIYIAKGRKNDLLRLASPPYTVGTLFAKQNISNLRMRVRIHELSEGLHNLGLKVEIIKLYHAYGGHGFRIELEDKVVAYTGDTGDGDNMQKLTQNADILISECSYFLPTKSFAWGHLDPELVASIARDFNVKKLILTHFDPSVYTTLKKRHLAEKKAKKIFKNTICAVDNLSIIV